MGIKKYGKALAALAAMFVVSVELSGCATTLDNLNPTSHTFAEGNWQFVATGSKSAVLPTIAGSLMGPSTDVHGVLHVAVEGGCVSPDTLIQVSGFTNINDAMILTASLAGGTFHFYGGMSADGTAMGGAAYKVDGGSCASDWVYVTAQNYKAISGTYTGALKDSSGLTGTLNAALSQSSQPDESGKYTLAGQGTFTAFPCLTSPAVLTNTEVTGNSVKMTYYEPVSTDSVVATGELSSDAKSVVITNWTLSGHCTADTGTGTLLQRF